MRLLFILWAETATATAVAATATAVAATATAVAVAATAEEGSDSGIVREAEVMAVAATVVARLVGLLKGGGRKRAATARVREARATMGRRRWRWHLGPSHGHVPRCTGWMRGWRGRRGRCR